MKLSLRLVILTLFALSLSAMPSGGAQADDCETTGEGAFDSVGIGMTCASPGASVSVPNAPATHTAEPSYVSYAWVSACSSINDPGSASAIVDCAAARSCTDPVERLWRLWGRRPEPDPGWDLLGSQCFGRPPTAADTPRPQVTPAVVLNALRRIGLPQVEAVTQPEGKTLVNFATIFYAEPESFARTLTLLGQQVEVEAEPVRFVWHHGDGTSQTTTSAGAPYPSKEITYSYTNAHTTVATSVDVSYAARFRVNGGGWQDIAEAVTIAGPSSPLRVSEATAVLSGNYG